jgi:hypothetical protein
MSAAKTASALAERITPQFSGRALPCDARHARIMKWSARGVAAMPFHGPLQLLVRRWHNALAHKQSPLLQPTMNSMK